VDKFPAKGKSLGCRNIQWKQNLGGGGYYTVLGRKKKLVGEIRVEVVQTREKRLFPPRGRGRRKGKEEGFRKNEQNRDRSPEGRNLRKLGRGAGGNWGIKSASPNPSMGKGGQGVGSLGKGSGGRTLTNGTV